MSMFGRRSVAGLFIFAALNAGGSALAAPATSHLAARVASVVERPEFRRAQIGIEFLDVATHRPIFSMNEDRLFAPASTTKVVTVGGALQALGPNYRYHTRVYRIGAIDATGTLHGDLVLVAAGDPDLSGRARPDGTLAFNDEDHSYGGDPVSGDPLEPLRDIARQVSAHGIKAVDGRILVDASLFPEGDVESGTGFVVSPACLNDNIVDVRVTPGAAVGSPAAIVDVTPRTSYVTFVDKAKTGPAGSDNTLAFTDVANPDGSRTATLAGSVPLRSKSAWIQYGVPVPSAFLRFTLADVLTDAGIAVQPPARVEPAVDFKVLAQSYVPANLLAEHVSLPLAQDALITLKTSQNLHATMLPYLVGALLGKDHDSSNRAGLAIEARWLRQAGLDLSEASQQDGEGTAFFTPDFMARYLAFIAGRPWFSVLFDGLPVLGRDGTLVDIQAKSRAAGHVFAKTGTDTQADYLNGGDVVLAKGLAGYFTTRSGRRIAFAIYINNVIVRSDADVTDVTGQAVGEIAAIGYETIP